MRRVLITGSNGLLGQKLLDLYLERREAQLIATSRGANRYPGMEGYGYTYQSMDVSNRDEVMLNILRYCPTAVINTAAMTNVDACEQNKEECEKLNVEAVKYLVEGCNMYDIQLIHLSTDFIFDGAAGPYSEDATPNPLSYYGESKLRAEQYIIENCKSYAILRTVLVYGVASDMSRSNIVLWVKNSLEQGKPIKVVSDQFRTPTLAEDLAVGCYLAEKNNAQGVFNISGRDFMNVYELAVRVADFWKLDSSLIEKTDSSGFTQPAKRPLRTGFTLSKSRDALGYEPRSFEEGLALMDKQLNKPVPTFV
ncbi:MAG TPA: NAD(P)-dependent oxidoreductase [Bacteroidia bacterium]|nr:NAD(P)-dependent oxidoreductase [Bacteroidia bacterium]